ncbi:MAG: CoA transferase [Solirubrobacterales bacterium]|nr:CoA transferase [Solirubrobacterales bacterium]
MSDATGLPLEGIFVLDFSQYLAGPSAGLRLADLGARVLKIERPGAGEPTRLLSLAGLELDGDSLLFHTINRNKESLAADLRNADDLDRVKKLVAHADVLIQSFRPGVMERYGLDYPTVSKLNERLVYGSTSGYGDSGPWRDRPGQDLLVQALSGLTWLSGNSGDPPVAFGLSIIDTLAGAHLCQGILACLVRRAVTGRGGYIEVSLLESALDLQFEALTCHLNDGQKLPVRSQIGGAHPYLGAPYGIYATSDGFIALAMGSVPVLGSLLELPDVAAIKDPAEWYERRDEIKARVADALATRPSAEWVELLSEDGLWVAEVLSWPELLEHEAVRQLEIVVDVGEGDRRFRTVRCPIRIDRRSPDSSGPSPRLGEHAPLPGEAR